MRNTDATAHFLFSRQIRNAGHTFVKQPDRVLTEGFNGYPFLMHWFLSFLPRSALERIDKHFSGITDVLHALVFLALYSFEILSGYELLLCLGLFLVSPQFMRPDMSHGLGLSARKPGSFLTTLSLVLILYGLSGNPTFLIAGMFTGSLIFLTSKFSVQAFLFFSFIISIFTSPTSALLFVGSFLFAILISFGTYISVLQGHISHITDFAVRKQYTYLNRQFFPRFNDMGSINSLLNTFHKSDLIRSMSMNPYIVGAGLTLGYARIFEIDLALPSGYAVWAVAAIVCFLGTSLPHLWFLGHSERYLEHAFVPSSVIIVTSMSVLGEWYTIIVGILFVVSLGGVLTNIYVFIKPNQIYTPAERDAYDELLNTLKEIEPGVVIAQPLNQGREIVWDTNHRAIDYVVNEGTTKAAIEERERLSPRYPFVTKDIQWVDNEFSIDWAVFNRMRTDESREGILHEPPIEPYFENKYFALYRFDDIVDSVPT